MKDKKKERPGVIVYFDDIRTLEKMSPAAQGMYLMACLRYGRASEIPVFEGLCEADMIRLETLWEHTQPRIDSDAQGWADSVMQRRYAGYASGCERKGEQPMDYDTWKIWRVTMDTRLKEDGYE